MRAILIPFLLFSYLSLAASSYVGLPSAASPRWKAPVATSASLPASNNTAGDARVANDTGTVYVWSGSGWITGTGGGSFATPVLLPNGTAGAPALAFTNNTDSGLYRVGTGEFAISVTGVKTLDFIESTGGGHFGNVGLGGPASVSDSYPLLMQRTLAGAVNAQLGNPDTGAGSLVKFQSVSDNGNNVMEMTSVTSASSAPDSYSGGGGILRFNSQGFSNNLVLVSDSSASSLIKTYVGGDASTNEILRLSTTTATLLNETHLKSTGTAPTATVNANAGTGGACSLSNASDMAGTINITTTATSPGTGEICKVNFQTAYGVAPICVVSAASATTASLLVLSQEYVTATTGKLSLNFGATDAAGHTYAFTYHCIETQ